METRANYVAVGAFVLILLAGSFVAMIWLLRVQFRTEYSYFETHFEGPVTGLGKGAPARLNGIEVGRVQEIEFDPDDPKLVVVILQLRAALVIHSDAVASLETQGLTGVSYVEITGGTKESPPLEAKEGRRYPIIASNRPPFRRSSTGRPKCWPGSSSSPTGSRTCSTIRIAARSPIRWSICAIRRPCSVAAPRIST